MAEIAKIKGYDIRDKKLADATSQSTVAATDAIEMKTTSGDQVYITRDSFVQAMASVLNSNSRSTISQLFGADANGNHAAINMGNLAKILSGNLRLFYHSDYHSLDSTFVLNDITFSRGVNGAVCFALALCSFGRTNDDNSVKVCYLYPFDDLSIKVDTVLDDKMALTGDIEFSVDSDKKLNVTTSGYVGYVRLTILAITR